MRDPESSGGPREAVAAAREPPKETGRPRWKLVALAAPIVLIVALAAWMVFKQSPDDGTEDVDSGNPSQESGAGNI